MKNFVILLLVTLTTVTCMSPIVLDPEGSIQNNYSEKLASFLGTKADFPLEETIWVNNTGEEFDKYLCFCEGNAMLFYGRYDDGLERHSDFYSSPYTIENNMVVTNISYPSWGDTKKTESINIIKSDNDFTLVVDGNIYTFYGTDWKDIETPYIIVHAGITPWE